jgi:hypothetical protein
MRETTDLRKGRTMKKTMMVKKLEIAKETLRRLDNKDLLEAAGGSGGGWSDNSVCPTVTSNRCP